MRSVVCAAAAKPIISNAALIPMRRSFRMVALPVLGMPPLKLAPLGCCGHRMPGIDAAGWVKIPVLRQVRLAPRKQCRASDGKPWHAHEIGRASGRESGCDLMWAVTVGESLRVC